MLRRGESFGVGRAAKVPGLADSTWVRDYLVMSSLLRLARSCFWSLPELLELWQRQLVVWGRPARVRMRDAGSIGGLDESKTD